MALPSPKELPKKLEGKNCFKCQGYDHFQYDYPKQRAMTIQEVKQVDVLLMEAQEETHEADSDYTKEET